VVADQDGTRASRLSLLRWVEFVGATAVLVAAAVWLLLPAAGGGTVSPPLTMAAPLAVGSLDGGHGHGNLPKGYVGPALSPPLQVSSPEPTPTGAPPARQYLAAMRPFAGANNVEPVTGRTMAVPCATGEGRDLYREVRYHLRRTFSSLTAQLVHRGAGARTRVQILGVDGLLAEVWVEPGRAAPIAVTVTDSEYLRIRVYCASAASAVEFRDALATR
jgi:hypothetical protein